MIQHAAIPMTVVAPEDVLRRLEEKLKDPQRRKAYDEWARSRETRENVDLLRDVFCRPAEGPVPGDQAIWVLGFNSGAWAICDSIMTLKPIPPPMAEPDTTYGDGDDSATSGDSNKKGGGQ